jgi:hypothetical protein
VTIELRTNLGQRPGEPLANALARAAVLAGDRLQGLRRRVAKAEALLQEGTLRLGQARQGSFQILMARVADFRGRGLTVERHGLAAQVPLDLVAQVIADPVKGKSGKLGPARWVPALGRAEQAEQTDLLQVLHFEAPEQTPGIGPGAEQALQNPSREKTPLKDQLIALAGAAKRWNTSVHAISLLP